jgi:hypothetical protein
MYFAFLTPIRKCRFAAKIIRSDNERAVWRGVSHIDHAQHAAHQRGTDCNSRSITSGAIFARTRENFLNLRLSLVTVVVVWYFGLVIDVEAKLHRGYERNIERPLTITLRSDCALRDGTKLIHLDGGLDTANSKLSRARSQERVVRGRGLHRNLQ